MIERRISHDNIENMSEFQTLVINVAGNAERKKVMEVRLRELNLTPQFVRAVEPKDFANLEKFYLTSTAQAVWLSHLKCLSIAAESNCVTLILEDDSVLSLNQEKISKIVAMMETQGIDLIQIGYLDINIIEKLVINLKNLYSFFTRNSLAADFFLKIGFKEVGRARTQYWRKDLPVNFIVNDVRFGAHSYLVSPSFAKSILPLNSPAFLPADDFFVALSRAKSFKMIRLRRSLSAQDSSPSSFKSRFLLE